MVFHRRGQIHEFWKSLTCEKNKFRLADDFDFAVTRRCRSQFSSSITGADALDILEYQSNAWGQPVLQGVSWGLIWIFVAAGLAIVICHAMFAVWRKRGLANNVDDVASIKNVDE